MDMSSGIFELPKIDTKYFTWFFCDSLNDSSAASLRENSSIIWIISYFIFQLMTLYYIYQIIYIYL